MPIYAYRCEECGFSKDVLQKISDPVLTVCPSCAKPSFKKQVTAAGFQLKGSGWYVTDFRGGTPPAAGTAHRFRLDPGGMGSTQKVEQRGIVDRDDIHALILREEAVRAVEGLLAVDHRADIAGQRHLRQRHRDAAVRDVVHRR